MPSRPLLKSSNVPFSQLFANNKKKNKKPEIAAAAGQKNLAFVISAVCKSSMGSS